MIPFVKPLEIIKCLEIRKENISYVIPTLDKKISWFLVNKTISY